MCVQVDPEALCDHWSNCVTHWKVFQNLHRLQIGACMIVIATVCTYIEIKYFASTVITIMYNIDKQLWYQDE